MIQWRFKKNGLLRKVTLRKHGLSGSTHLVPCDGEAHSNAHIDHCMTCAPRWGNVELPIEHKTVDEWRAFVAEQK